MESLPAIANSLKRLNFLPNQSADASNVHRNSHDSEDVGQRIDNFLLRNLKGLPRQRIYKILRSGEVRVNGGRVNPAIACSWMIESAFLR